MIGPSKPVGPITYSPPKEISASSPSVCMRDIVGRLLLPVSDTMPPNRINTLSFTGCHVALLSSTDKRVFSTS
jgi:hypothetical protein